MLTVRKAQDRGHAKLGWLDSWHTFSFSNYYDPKHMGFRSLRVINDDTVAPGRGFGMHPHEDMEIITYMLDGAVAHQDSMGTGATLRPGDVQRMSDGTGIVHSEMNPSPATPAHFLQIWIEPDAQRVTPRYEDRHFPLSERTDRLRLIASPDGRDGSLAIHQDALIHAAVLTPGHRLSHALAPGRGGYLQVAKGAVDVDGVALGTGDAVAAEAVERLGITAGPAGAEILLFDVA